MRLRPNQGIRNSGWNALRSGLGSWLVVGMLGALIGGLVGWLIGKLLTGLGIGLLAGLGFGLFVGPIIGLFYGGGAYLQHYCLRCLLWRRSAIPWHFVRFLEEASEHILLQRVGGGYRFIHPLFQDYFASLSTAALPLAIQQP
jgi:eukaryotic-like serine/threonine-protein kinase